MSTYVTYVLALLGFYTVKNNIFCYVFSFCCLSYRFINVIIVMYLKETLRRIHVDSTSLSRRYVEVQISTNFHVIFTYFIEAIRWLKTLRCFHALFSMQFRWSKNPRYFQVLRWCNFNGRKIYVVSTYFSRCNFSGRNVVFTYFFWRDFDGKKFEIVFG